VAARVTSPQDLPIRRNQVCQISIFLRCLIIRTRCRTEN
jgi:hypothetical protein